jgi:hypothetical protein
MAMVGPCWERQLFDLSFTQSFDVPGLSLTANFANGDTTDHTVTVIVDGRAN